MARILVTGANGFIGQHLCRRLVDEGHTVRGLILEELPLYFIKQEELEWVRADLDKPQELKGVCSSIDIVFHLGAIPRNDLSKSWEDFVRTNIEGTQALLKEAQEARISRFILSSTVEAAGYGDGVHPRRETDTPAPLNNYGKSKLKAEEWVLRHSWPFECTVMRLPMIYGPGTMLIVPKLFGMVKKHLYPLIGFQDTLMEFCYVGNAVQALCLGGFHPDAANELFYLSDARSYSIREVVTAVAEAMAERVLFLRIPKPLAWFCAATFELCAQLLPIPPLVSPISKKPFFTRETVAWTTRNVNIVATTKIRNHLGYTPPYSIHEGCRLTAHWLKAQGVY